MRNRLSINHRSLVYVGPARLTISDRIAVSANGIQTSVPTAWFAATHWRPVRKGKRPREHKSHLGLVRCVGKGCRNRWDATRLHGPVGKSLSHPLKCIRRSLTSGGSVRATSGSHSLGKGKRTFGASCAEVRLNRSIDGASLCGIISYGFRRIQRPKRTGPRCPRWLLRSSSRIFSTEIAANSSQATGLSHPGAVC